MTQHCEHRFENAPAVFVATLQTRICKNCKRVDVMIAATGEWKPIEEYVQERIVTRTQASL